MIAFIYVLCALAYAFMVGVTLYHRDWYWMGLFTFLCVCSWKLAYDIHRG